MRLFFIIAIVCFSSNVCLGQDSAFSKADFYWPRWTMEGERELSRKNPTEYESSMLEGLRVKEHIEDMQWEEADTYCRQTLQLYADHIVAIPSIGSESKLVLFL